jgi:hypothetical protein
MSYILVTLTCGGTGSENCTYFDSPVSVGAGVDAIKLLPVVVAPAE